MVRSLSLNEKLQQMLSQNFKSEPKEKFIKPEKTVDEPKLTSKSSSQFQLPSILLTSPTSDSNTSNISSPLSNITPLLEREAKKDERKKITKKNRKSLTAKKLEEEKKAYDELKVEYDSLKQKLEAYERKEEFSDQQLVEGVLKNKNTSEIEELRRSLLIEKELIEQEKEKLSLEKSKLEELCDENSSKRNEIEEETELLEEMSVYLSKERQTLEQEAHTTFTQIGLLQEAKSAIVSGSTEDFIKSIQSLNSIDMVLSSDEARYTLLHWAVVYNQQQMVSELLKRGARLLPSTDGNTPLDIAKAAYNKGCTSFSTLIDLFVRNPGVL